MEGPPVARQDDAGHRIVFKRDRDRKLVQLLSPSGYSLKFEYDEAYRVRRAADDQGRVVRYEYDADGRLALTNDGTRQTRFRYADTLLSSIVTDTGTVVEITYPEKHVINLALANGREFTFSPVFGNGTGRAATAVEITEARRAKTVVQLAQ